MKGLHSHFLAEKSASKLANVGINSCNGLEGDKHAHVLFLAPAADWVSPSVTTERKGRKNPMSPLTHFSDIRGRFLSNSYPREPKTT